MNKQPPITYHVLLSKINQLQAELHAMGSSAPGYKEKFEQYRKLLTERDAIRDAIR